MSITAKDIAKKLNISAASVSMALNNKPGVSDELRAKIFDTANEMGFQYSEKKAESKIKFLCIKITPIVLWFFLSIFLEY